MFVALAGCLIASSVGAEMTRFNLRGKGATANWWQWVAQCTVESVYVIVSDDQYREDHKGKEDDLTWKTSTVRLEIIRYNICDFHQEVLLQAEATLDPGAFQARDLKEASLWAIIPVYDANGQATFFTLDIQWSGTDVIYTGRSNSFFTGPGFTFRNSYNGRTRVADVWGTITNGTKNFAGGIASWGDIHVIKSGYVDVIK